MRGQRDPGAVRRRAEAVKARVPLSQLVGRDVRLFGRGAEKDGLCPFHADGKIGSFKVNDAKRIYKCFACGASGDHFSYLKERAGLDFMAALQRLETDAGIAFADPVQRAALDREVEAHRRAEAEAGARRRESARGLWMHALPLRATPAEAYLRGRGIAFEQIGGQGVATYPGAIRFHPECWCGERRAKGPAMVSAMMRVEGGATVFAAAHRTYLERVAGRWVKARIDQPKMTLGAFNGAHIPLTKGAGGRVPLAQVAGDCVPMVSEGVEDGLSVACAMPARRVIAAATLGNIGALVLPDAIRTIEMIEQNDDEWRTLMALRARAAGDGDAEGRHLNAAEAIDRAKAANVRAHQAAGRAVLRLWPAAGFKDFNDQLNGLRMAGGAGA